MATIKLQMALFVLIACGFLENDAKPVIALRRIIQSSDDCCYNKCYPIDKCPDFSSSMGEPLPFERIEHPNECCFQVCYAEESCPGSILKLSETTRTTTTTTTPKTSTTTPTAAAPSVTKNDLKIINDPLGFTEDDFNADYSDDKGLYIMIHNRVFWAEEKRLQCILKC